jgi:hypothetical protein
MQAKQGSPEDPGGERKEEGFGKEEVKAKNLVVDAQKKVTQVNDGCIQ